MRYLGLICLLLCLPGLAFAADAAAPDFNTEVRPILSATCFKCHGPDEGARKAKLRLDQRESATHPAKSGEIPIVPHAPERSELVKRITTTDPDDVMPPRDSNKTLTPAQRSILTRWIASGADYKPHWAFVAPVRAPLPKVTQADWPRNPIDHFVLARLEQTGLHPSAEADRTTLIRRVSLDLIGLPPTPAEVDAFLADKSADAYEKLVDRLLNSPQYGERWARHWLDLARYSDSNGYEKDRGRSMWPYRDWVINALNADMPFDQFTIKQIAGDLLPGATQDDRIATGFHRNTMLNEEGGIDPLEYRFASMVDRVSTTGKTWLGLTLGCAQCHTHKFDPITQREYYQLMAFMDNVDEPQLMVEPADIASRRAANQARIDALVATLPSKFPASDPLTWTVLEDATLTTQSGEKGQLQPDGSWRFTGPGTEQDSYTLTGTTNVPEITALRLEAIPDPGNPLGGPGRAQSGNFVLNKLIFSTVSAGTSPNPANQPLHFAYAQADFSQNNYDVKGAIDGDANAGWAVYSQDKTMNTPHSAVFTLATPVHPTGSVRLMVRLDQHFGQHHTLGHFRVSVGSPLTKSADPNPVAKAIDRAFTAWMTSESAQVRPWKILRPDTYTTNMPYLTLLEDGSLLAGGDQTKNDVYTLTFSGNLHGITALRLEVLPDPSLPAGGPGRAYYEGALGDFGLSEFTASSDNQPVKFASALQSFVGDGHIAANAIDGKSDTLWSINGGQGKAHNAVFILEAPLKETQHVTIALHFERYYANGLGRFRLSATTAPPPASTDEVPNDLIELLTKPASQLQPAQRQRLLSYWLESVSPELSEARAEIDRARGELQSFPTTLVMRENPPGHTRPTYIHHRGEWLQPTERVTPEVLSVLNPLPAGSPHDRLAFARWLVARDQPLTARVIVNRQWAAFFGRGLVRTVDDFGYQGEPPSHPELLDWLAVEFMEKGWSLKRLHRLIVTSASYRQSSVMPPNLLVKDPANILLARGPTQRIDAEAIRDSLLRAAGLLSTKVGGPSVFPPQPDGIFADIAYVAFPWQVSGGEDRYRRGLYTFSKRTAPYAMSNTFDGPTGEVCIAQREVSDSPLQALTMLNDTVIMEAAQALGRQFSEQSGSAEDRIVMLFRRCLVRTPEAAEATQLLAFLEKERHRFATKELDPGPLAGAGSADASERAAWTALARVLFNTDEFITKE